MSNRPPVAIFRDTIHPERLALPDPSYDGVFYYVNGPESEWPAHQVRRFRSAGKRLHAFDVTGGAWQLADVLDVERGDASPEQVPDWVDNRWKHHSTAGVYCNKSTLPFVVASLDGRPCYLIIADPTGARHIPELALPKNIVLAGVQDTWTADYDVIAIYSRAWLEGARIA